MSNKDWCLISGFSEEGDLTSEESYVGFTVEWDDDVDDLCLQGMFLQPVHTEKLVEDKESFVCFYNDNRSFEPNAITLKKRKVELVSKQRQQEGASSHVVHFLVC